ncbi:hypothetical protein ACFWJY_00365 [Streptomyces anulatus]|uniref:hypothetical protein n=1 Tax=Streptomyces anulatus TaxID=1892 RepID=UPI0036666C0C
MSEHVAIRPAAAAVETVRYQFLVPAHVTASVQATSEAEARKLLTDESSTSIELDQPAPLRSGALSITRLDMIPPAAKVDMIGDEPVDGSLPDAAFAVSDIARVAARNLEGDWESEAGAGGVSAQLTSEEAGFGYSLEMIEGALSLFHQDAFCACARFELTDSLSEMADRVADAVNRDVRYG